MGAPAAASVVLAAGGESRSLRGSCLLSCEVFATGKASDVLPGQAVYSSARREHHNNLLYRTRVDARPWPARPCTEAVPVVCTCQQQLGCARGSVLSSHGKK